MVGHIDLSTFTAEVKRKAEPDCHVRAAAPAMGLGPVRRERRHIACLHPVIAHKGVEYAKVYRPSIALVAGHNLIHVLLLDYLLAIHLVFGSRHDVGVSKPVSIVEVHTQSYPENAVAMTIANSMTEIAVQHRFAVIDTWSFHGRADSVPPSLNS